MTTEEENSATDLVQQLQLLPKPLSYELLDYFCCLNYSQRRDFILDILKKMGIAHRILRTQNAFHIIVQPEYELEKTQNLQVKCFIAHYDRRIKTPGVNDNSAAVWHLLNLTAQMKRECPTLKNPIQIILTDCGELHSKDDIRQQGAYHLAQYLRQKHPELHYTFFVFDQCGIGNTLCYLPNIFARPALLTQQDEILQEIQQGIRLPIHRVRNYQYYFSDNLGFNLWGYPALLFSTLPQEELRHWEKTGKKPATWQNTHTDTPKLLEARSFALLSKMLGRLCRL